MPAIGDASGLRFEQPPERRLELIDGELIAKPMSGMVEGVAKVGLAAALRSVFHTQAGGWWLAASVDTQLGSDGFRPDLAGWRRDRSPLRPEGWPCILRPDWVCEVTDPRYLVRKLPRFHQAGVEHCWVVDAEAGELSVFRHEPGGYLKLLTARRGQRIRAEPFDAIELNVSDLLGDFPRSRVAE